MKRLGQSHQLILLSGATGLLLLFAFLLTSTARKKSLVYDEVIYSPMGVLYWKTGDFRWNAIHPPLQKLISSIPLLNKNIPIPPDIDPARDDEWRTGYRIFFESDDPAIDLIFLSRLPTIFVSVLLGLAVFLWTWKHTASSVAPLLALAALVFDPLVLGNGSLAMNDLFVTAFFFFSLIWFKTYLEKESSTKREGLKWVMLCGLSTGAAISSKLSGCLLLPIYAYFVATGKNRLINSKPLLWIAALAGIVFFGCYGFNINFIFNAFSKELALHTEQKTIGFLLVPLSGHTGWFYYPIATLIKTPLPLLFLWLGSLFTLWRQRSDPKTNFYFIYIPIATIWLAALLIRNHFGVRYLLPATPFLAVGVGVAYDRLSLKIERSVFWILALWLATQTFLSHPHHMSYFNQLVGGSAQGYKWLDGSNQDWGQDLPALAVYLQSQDPKPAVCMGYWGSNRPEAWGIEYQDVYSPAITNSFRIEKMNGVDIDREVLVVSASLLSNPSSKEAYKWLKRKTPLARIGNTLFVYDITSDIESILNISYIYYVTRRFSLARRQIQRALFIKPSSKPLIKEWERYEKLIENQNGIVSPGEGTKNPPE